jgi:hypothetical protein
MRASSPEKPFANQLDDLKVRISLLVPNDNLRF